MTRVKTDKVTVYLGERTAAELRGEADRLDRSVSWVVSKAWQLCKSEFERLPGRDDFIEEAKDSIRYRRIK